MNKKTLTAFLVGFSVVALSATVEFRIASNKVESLNGKYIWGNQTITHSTTNILRITASQVMLNTNTFWVNGSLYDPTPLTGNFPDLFVYEPTNGYPAAFTAYEPPVEAESYSTPMIAEWIRSADEDRTVAFASEETITDFVFHGLTTNEVSPVLHETYGIGYGRVTSPEDGFKMAWPVTASTTGTPIRLNNTIAWWLGPDLCDTNQQFNIYGNNLAESGTVHAYIDGYGWITDDWHNNQKATFTVPSDLDYGIHTIYAHNGKGGKYGWGNGHQLKVAPLIDYTDSEVTVTSGSFSDLLAKWKAADANSTVNIPAGTYYFTEELRKHSAVVGAGLANDNVWFKGAGTGETIFVADSTFPQNAEPMEGDDYLIDIGSTWGVPRERFGLKFSGITFDRGDGSPMPDGLFRIIGGNHHIENCEFTDVDLPTPTTGGYAICSFNGSEFGPAWVTNCTFIQTDQVSCGPYVRLSHNKFYGRNDKSDGVSSLGRLITLSGTHNADLNNNYGAPLDDSNIYLSCQGRFIFSGNIISYHNYIGQNVTLNMDPMPTSGHENSGEQILFENAGPKLWDEVSSAGTNWVEAADIASITVDVRYSVTIIDGKGFGQTRIASGYASGTRITLTENWLIVPDTTSVIAVQEAGWQNAIVGNYLDGKDDGNNTASGGVVCYGGPHSSLIVGNTGNQLEEGFVQWAYASEDPLNNVHANYAYFNVFEGNINTNIADHTGSDGGFGYYVNINGTDGAVYTPTLATLGITFRDNQAYGATKHGVTIVGNNEPHFNAAMIIMEHNSGTCVDDFADSYSLNSYTNNNVFTAP